MNAKVVKATPSLLAEVEGWLRAEEELYDTACATWAESYETDTAAPVKGFHCNWNNVLEAFAENRDSVHILLNEGAAIGFVKGMDLFEIHPAHRRRGFGRILAEFMLQRAFERGFSVAEIAIAPQSATDFWVSMGFSVIEDRLGRGGGTYAFHRFDHTQRLGDGERILYRIAFYEEARDWNDAAQPFAEFEGEGELLPDQSIRLPQRAYCFNQHRDASLDDHVRVTLGGALLLGEKLKRPLVHQLGLKRDEGGIAYFDRLLPRDLAGEWLG